MERVRPTPDLALLRLLQLCSGNLPVGGFSYSQGIEWAVEQGWIRHADDLGDWLQEQIEVSLSGLELPLLARFYRACADEDPVGLQAWCDWLWASRESRELREEERNRARALTSLLIDLELPRAREWRSGLESCQGAGFAFAAVAWRIPLRQLALGYAWSWLETQVLAGIKLIPLGQTAGQRLLLHLAERLDDAVRSGLERTDDELGSSLPALSIASSRHETQYSRLFRS